MKKIFLFFLAICLVHLLPAQLSIQNGTYWKVSGNTYTVLNDVDLVNNGNLIMDDGFFKFTGNKNTSISGNQLTKFTDIILEKDVVNKVMLQRNINIENRLTFVSGLFDLNNFDVALAGTGFLVGENENSRVIGANGGKIKIDVNLSAPSSANPGNLGAIISSSQNLGTVIIQRGHQSQTNGAGGGNSILRYYDIIPANNTALNATLRFHYLNAELNGLAENNLVLWKSINNTNWTNEGYTSRDMTTNYVEKTGIPGFSRWTLSSVGNALPVTGLKLSGRWHNNASQLDWVTLAEYNNRHFTIERKYNNENNFTVVGVKNSLHADGNSQSPSSYHWIDPAAANKGNIFYRLHQVDLDGKFSYSNIITIRPDVAELFVEKLYPTAGVQQSIYMQTGNLDLKQVEISLYDMTGRLYMKKKVNYESQWLQLPLLTAGAYQLHIVSGEWRYQSNFIKQ